jgi:hypothetical protein
MVSCAYRRITAGRGCVYYKRSLRAARFRPQCCGVFSHSDRAWIGVAGLQRAAVIPHHAEGAESPRNPLARGARPQPGSAVAGPEGLAGYRIAHAPKRIPGVRSFRACTWRWRCDVSCLYDPLRSVVNVTILAALTSALVACGDSATSAAAHRHRRVVTGHRRGSHHASLISRAHRHRRGDGHRCGPAM